MILPPGGFAVLGLLLAAKNAWENRRKRVADKVQEAAPVAA
jgi:hypothetical protein